jgi:hypothetical protein
VHTRTFYKSGDRQPAVVRETHLSVRFRKVAGVCQRCDHEPRCSRGSESTGGLRPPRSCVGVRMPAGEIAICAMHKRTSAGAAGVSPPWFGNRTCDGDRSSSGDHVHHARSDGTPRLDYVSRSWCRSWRTHANRCGYVAPFLHGRFVSQPRLAYASRSWCTASVR